MFHQKKGASLAPNYHLPQMTVQPSSSSAIPFIALPPFLYFHYIISVYHIFKYKKEDRNYPDAFATINSELYSFDMIALSLSQYSFTLLN